MPLPRALGSKLFRGTVTRVDTDRAWVELSSIPGYEVGGDSGLAVLVFTPAPAAGDKVLVAELTSPAGEMIVIGTLAAT